MTWFDPEMHSEQLTVMRVTSGKPDANGRATTTTVRHELEGYSVVPVGSQETLGDDKVVTTRFRVSGPETDVVREQDSVTWRGKTYAVHGEPQTFGKVLPHTEFYLQLDRG